MWVSFKVQECIFTDDARKLEKHVECERSLGESIFDQWKTHNKDDDSDDTCEEVEEHWWTRDKVAREDEVRECPSDSRAEASSESDHKRRKCVYVREEILN